MTIKGLFNNGLKSLGVFISFAVIISCSNDNSEEWPKLQADNLWQDLAERKSEEAVLQAQENAQDRVSPSKPPYEGEKLSLDEVKKELREIEFLLPLREEAVHKALNDYLAASSEDKATYWRGVEIEKSRINDIASQLRLLEYKLQNNNHAIVEKELITKLLKKAVNMTPAMPEDLGQSSM